jgi:hypothetical protein
MKHLKLFENISFDDIKKGIEELELYDKSNLITKLSDYVNDIKIELDREIKKDKTKRYKEKHKDFIKFINSIASSKNSYLKKLMEEIEFDVDYRYEKIRILSTDLEEHFLKEKRYFTIGILSINVFKTKVVINEIINKEKDVKYIINVNIPRNKFEKIGGLWKTIESDVKDSILYDKYKQYNGNYMDYTKHYNKEEIKEILSELKYDIEEGIYILVKTKKYK